MKTWGIHALYGIVIVACIIFILISSRGHHNTVDNLERAEDRIRSAAETRRGIEAELAVAADRNSQLTRLLAAAEDRNSELTEYARNIEIIINTSTQSIDGITGSLERIGGLIEAGEKYNEER